MLQGSSLLSLLFVSVNKWILAQKLRIPTIQLGDHVKLKEKEDQSVDALVLLRRGQDTHWRKYGDKV